MIHNIGAALRDGLGLVFTLVPKLPVVLTILLIGRLIGRLTAKALRKGMNLLLELVAVLVTVGGILVVGSGLIAPMRQRWKQIPTRAGQEAPPATRTVQANSEQAIGHVKAQASPSAPPSRAATRTARRRRRPRSSGRSTLSLFTSSHRSSGHVRRRGRRIGCGALGLDQARTSASTSVARSRTKRWTAEVSEDEQRAPACVDREAVTCGIRLEKAH